MLAAAILLHLFKSLVVLLLIYSELLKLHLKVEDGFLDALLALLSGMLLFALFGPLLLVLLDAVDFVLEVLQSISQVLDQLVLAAELLLHEFDLLGVRRCPLLLRRHQVIVVLSERWLHYDASVHVAFVFGGFHLSVLEVLNKSLREVEGISTFFGGSRVERETIGDPVSLFACD